MTESQIQLWDALLHALQNNNVQAALRVVRNGESSAGDDEAYKALYGWKPGNGKVFDSFDDHPRKAFQSPWGWTSAAGAYQAMCAVPGYVKTDTWGDFLKDVGPRDFTPASQDAFGVWCFRRRGALQDIIAGRIREAIRKCRKEWASLPDAGYGQPEKSLEEALRIYQAYGGADIDVAVNGQVDSPVPVPANPSVTQPEVTVTKEVPNMGVFLPLILQLIPSLISVFGSPTDSEVAKRNQAAGVLVANTLIKATDANNLADAVGKMQSNPDALQAATDAVHELLPQLLDVGGGVETARKFAADHEGTRYGRVLEVVTYSGLFFLLLANLAAFAFAWDSKDFTVMADIKQADIGVALIVFGYWLGTSISSKRKDELKGAQ